MSEENSYEITEKNTFKPIVIRTDVESKKNYLDYREPLRSDFYYSCAYCSITEFEASAIGFEIDHYMPVNKFPEKKVVYQNLMWSCEHCNGRKKDFYPTENQKQKGRFIIRVDESDPREHLELEVDGAYLQEKSETGKFNINRLDLNRHSLLRLRKIRRKIWDSQNYIAHGVSEILKIGLDEINPNYRKKFLEFRRDIIDEYKKILNGTNEFVRGIARSPLLDEDTEKSDRHKGIREYLKDVKALGPDYDMPKLNKNRQEKKKKRNKKKK